MQIRKRSLPAYIFLNCLTLGIYGLVVTCRMGKEIDFICRNDGEAPRFSYMGAVALRGISGLVGIIVGLIAGIRASSVSLMGISFRMSFLGSVQAVTVFLSMAIYGLAFSVVGSFLSGIYLKFWWYKQASRLKLNGYRYGVDVKESGTDTFLFHTAFEIVLLPLTAVLIALSCLLPGLLCWLFMQIGSVGVVVFASVMAFLFSLPLIFCGMDLTAGSNFARFFIFKNLNRFADASRNGGASFDPMGYEYYPSFTNKYPNRVPEWIIVSKKIIDPDETVIPQGFLTGIKGSCAGYKFDINPGEEIIIGKDAKVSMIVIDPQYKEVSRKHLGVRFDAQYNQYIVVDYSSNGTWANGVKLEQFSETYLPAGTILKLANEKNIFRLG